MAAVGGQGHGAQAQAQAGNGELGGQHVVGEQGVQRIEQVTGGTQYQRGAQGNYRENMAAVGGGEIVAQTTMAQRQGDHLGGLHGRQDSQPGQQVLPGNRRVPVGPHQGNGAGDFQQNQYRNATQ